MFDATVVSAGPPMGHIQECSRCILDQSIPEIRFDASGLCSYCQQYDQLAMLPEHQPQTRDEYLQRLVKKIQASGKSRRYDCVIGVSGGVDSSYALFVAKKKLGLRPLAVHLDNGWNSELAVQNIENLVRKLDIDLYTHVIDWEEFRELQLSFLKASVVDLELPTDHAIAAALYQQSRRHGVRYLLTGDNFATECVLPPGWNHPKSDWKNIIAIHKAYSHQSLKTFPHLGTIKMILMRKLLGVHQIGLLSYLPYVKRNAIAELEKEVGWRSYGGKHYESIITRFYQGYILPTKFGIDKRIIHFSRLICSGQMTKEEAKTQLKTNPYDPELLKADRIFVIKKFGLTEVEFEKIMVTPPRPHSDFASDREWVSRLIRWRQSIRLQTAAN